MQHLTMTDKSLLIGDEVADLLAAYAAVTASAGQGDHVTVLALGVDGEEVAAQILLNSGTTLLVESSHSRLPEPDDDALVLHLRDRLRYYGALPADSQPPGRVGEPD